MWGCSVLVDFWADFLEAILIVFLRNCLSAVLDVLEGGSCVDGSLPRARVPEASDSSTEDQVDEAVDDAGESHDVLCGLKAVEVKQERAKQGSNRLAQSE